MLYIAISISLAFKTGWPYPSGKQPTSSQIEAMQPRPCGPR